jgi:hypothetical protein
MRRAPLFRFAMLLLPALIAAGCAGLGAGSKAPDDALWDARVRTFGELRAIHHEGRTGAMVNLGSLLPNPNLYAVGALADLAGEVTIAAGTAYLSYPVGLVEAHTETTFRATENATLLVVAEVAEWQSVKTTRVVPFEDLDQAIADLAHVAGISSGQRFPFLVEGDVQDLQWHVIDGRRLARGETTHQDHLAASVRKGALRARATLVGFFSETDQGVFTHMGSRTHIHCVLDNPISSGHVDHVVLPAGTTVRFPVIARLRRSG